MVPDTQTVGPVYPIPPHCPYLTCVPPPVPPVVVGTAPEVTLALEEVTDVGAPVLALDADTGFVLE